MRNIVLLLVLLAGFLSGYLVGDWRAKAAREALDNAVATGKVLDAERETAITSLKTELDSINARHQRELDAIRKSNESKMAEWRRARDGLDGDIKRSNARLGESDARLKALTAQRDAAPAAERVKLDLEIARLSKECDALRREIEGSACLQARVPHSVSDALNEEGAAGRT